eukprot:CAMPEP_0114534328 /NCGR_PEP_ID=MMETSP0109-20121206/27777_1 /TAXON_ID=29199 /ORGANISM="Chlorarachnion reptans, Strain CCCM449" /LENGTH=4259 /DNA_ID=CAMNT_0001717725 /DNA_START=231 /DNA_END=13011 /DNA_ORIENTATION=-
MHFIKRLFKGKPKSETPTSQGKAETSTPKYSLGDLSKGPPSDPVLRMRWNMEVFCSHARSSARRWGHASVVTPTGVRALEKSYNCLREVIKSSDEFSGRAYADMEDTIQHFLECVSTALGNALFGQQERLDAKNKWREPVLLLSKFTPEDKRPKIQIVDIPSPYTFEILELMTKLCQNNQRARAINRSKIMSKLLMLQDALIHLSNEKIEDILKEEAVDVRGRANTSAAAEVFTPASAAQTNVRSFLVEEDDEEDEEDEGRTGMTRTDTKDADDEDEKVKKREEARKLLSRQMVISTIECIRDFLIKISRYPSTGIEMIRTNSLDLLLELIYTRHNNQPLVLRGQLAASDVLLTLLRKGFAHNVGELATTLERGQIAKMLRWLKSELSGVPGSSKQSFSLPVTRPRGTQRRVNKELIGPRALLMVKTVSMMRSVLGQTKNHKLFREFKELKGYETVCEIATWLEHLPEDQFKMRLKTVEELSASGREQKNAATDQSPTHHRDGLLSTLLGTMADFVFTGPEALPIPNAKNELIAFDGSDRFLGTHNSSVGGNTEDNIGSLMNEAAEAIMRVRNLDGYMLLMSTFRSVKLEGFKLEVLNRMLLVFTGHPDNYWLLYPLKITSALIKGLPDYSEQVRTMVMKIVDSVVVVVQAVPFQELTALSVVLSDLDCLASSSSTSAAAIGQGNKTQIEASEIAGVVIEATTKYAKVDKGYAKLVGKCGMLDVMFQHLISLRTYLTDSKEDQKLHAHKPVLCDLKAYEALSRCIVTMIENSAVNLDLFRKSKCHQAVLDLTAFRRYRPYALHMLTVPADQRGLSDMLELLHLSKNEHEQKVGIMYAVCTMLCSNVQAKQLWKKLAGFECMYTMLTRFHRVFVRDGPEPIHQMNKPPTKSTTTKQEIALDRTPIHWAILTGLFGVLTFSVKDCPTNRLHLWTQEGWKSIAAALRMSMVASRPDLIDEIIDILVALATEDTAYFIPVDVAKNAAKAVSSVNRMAVKYDSNADADADGDRKGKDTIKQSEFLTVNRNKSGISKDEKATKDSKLVLHNPLALLILLDLAETMEVKDQIKCLKKIHSLISLSNTLSNIQALSDVQALGFLLHYFPLMDLDRLAGRCALNDLIAMRNIPDVRTDEECEDGDGDKKAERIDRNSDGSRSHLRVTIDKNNGGKKMRKEDRDLLRSYTLKLVVILGGHHLHSLELKLLLHMIPQPLLNQLLLQMSASAQPTCSFVEFDTARKGFASIQVPKVLSRETGWLQDGFSWCAWLNIRQISDAPKKANALQLIRLETSSQVVCQFVVVRRQLKVYAHDMKTIHKGNQGTTPPILLASLKQHKFGLRRWTHVGLVYHTRFKRTALIRKRHSIRNEVKSPGNSSSKECGSLSLYVDGVLIETAVIPSGLDVSMNTADARIIFGNTAEDAKANQEQADLEARERQKESFDGVTTAARVRSDSKLHNNSISGVVWWMGPTVMVQGPLNAEQIQHLYALGFQSKSTFHPKRVSRFRPPAHYQHHVERQKYNILVKSNTQAATIGDVPKVDPPPLHGPLLPNDSVIFVFHAHARLDIKRISELLGCCTNMSPSSRKNRSRSEIKSPTSSSNRLKREHERRMHWIESDPARISSLLQYCSMTQKGVILLNTVHTPPPTSPIHKDNIPLMTMPNGILDGGARCIATCNAVDALRCVSGIRLLIPSIAHCTTSRELDEALTLFSILIHCNQANQEAMNGLGGYRLLAQILIDKGKLLNWRSLDVIFSMVEGRDPGTGSASNCNDAEPKVYTEELDRCVWRSWAPPNERRIKSIDAVKCLLLDWSIWAQSPASLQAAVFARLAQLCLWGPKHPGIEETARDNAVTMQKADCLRLILHVMLENGQLLSDIVVDSLSCLVETMMVETSTSLPDVGALASYLAVGVSGTGENREEENLNRNPDHNNDHTKPTVSPRVESKRMDPKKRIMDYQSNDAPSSNLGITQGFLLIDGGAGKVSEKVDQRDYSRFIPTPRVKMGLNIRPPGVVGEGLEATIHFKDAETLGLMVKVFNKRWFRMFLAPMVYPQVLESIVCFMHVMLCAPQNKDGTSANGLSKKVVHTMGFAVPYLVFSWPLYTSFFAILVGRISSTLLARSDSLSKLRAKKLFGLAAPSKHIPKTISGNDKDETANTGASGDVKDGERGLGSSGSDRMTAGSLSEAFDVFVLNADLVSDPNQMNPNPAALSLLLHLIEENSKALLQPFLSSYRMMREASGVAEDDPKKVSTPDAKQTKSKVEFNFKHGLETIRLPVTAIRFLSLLVHQSDKLKQALWQDPEQRNFSNPASSNIINIMRGSGVRQLVQMWFTLSRQQKLAFEIVASSNPTSSPTTPAHVSSSSPKNKKGDQAEEFHSNPVNSRVLASAEILESIGDLLCTLVQDIAMTLPNDAFTKSLERVMTAHKNISLARVSKFKLYLFWQLAPRLQGLLSTNGLQAYPHLLDNMNTLCNYFVGQLHMSLIKPQINPRIDMRDALGVPIPTRMVSANHINTSSSGTPLRRVHTTGSSVDKELGASRSNASLDSVNTEDESESMALTKDRFYICRIVDFVVHVLKLNIAKLRSVAKFVTSSQAGTGLGSLKLPKGSLASSEKRSSTVNLTMRKNKDAVIELSSNTDEKDLSSTLGSSAKGSPRNIRTLLLRRHRSYKTTQKAQVEAELCQHMKDSALLLFILVIHDYGSNPEILCYMFSKISDARSAGILFKRELVEALESGGGQTMAMDMRQDLFLTLCCHLHQHLTVNSESKSTRSKHSPKDDNKVMIVQRCVLVVWKKLMQFQRTRTEKIMTPSDYDFEKFLTMTENQKTLLTGFRKLSAPTRSTPNKLSASGFDPHSAFLKWYDVNKAEVDRVFNKTLAPSLSSFLENRAKLEEERKSRFVAQQVEGLSAAKEQRKKKEYLEKAIEEQRVKIIANRQQQELRRQKLMAHHMLHRRMQMRGMYDKTSVHLLHQTQATGPSTLPFLSSYPVTKRSLRLYHHFLPMTVIDPYHKREQTHVFDAAKESGSQFAPMIHDGVRMNFALDATEGPFRMRQKIVGHNDFYRIYGIDQKLLMVTDDGGDPGDANEVDPGENNPGSTANSQQGRIDSERVERSPSADHEQKNIMETAKIISRTAKKSVQSDKGMKSGGGSDETKEGAERDSSGTMPEKGVNKLRAAASRARRNHLDEDDEEDDQEMNIRKDSSSKNTPDDGGTVLKDLAAQAGEPQKTGFVSSTEKSPNLGKMRSVSSTTNPTSLADHSKDARKSPMLKSSQKPSLDEHQSIRKGSMDDIKTESASTTPGNDEWAEILMLLPPGEENSIWGVKNCSRISGLTRSNGVLFISKSCLYLIDNYEIDQEGALNVITELGEESKVECYYYLRPIDIQRDKDRDELTAPVLEVVKIRDESKKRNRQDIHPEERHKLRQFPYDSIIEIRKRRYQLQRVAIEVFNCDGSSELLSFDTKRDRDEVYNKLYSIGVHANPNDMRVGFSHQYTKHQAGGQTLIQMAFKGSKSLTAQWQDGEISNFTYLMYLNTLAGRSYNDLTQYPVFPWVLKNYHSDEIDLKDPNNFRDLSKPMGALDGSRKDKFLERYRNWEDPSGIIPKFHYGTHYASAATTLYYLLRLEPFARIALQLQGGKFDHADRLFYSIQHSWHSSSADGGMSDVKELIPEFYYLPDFLQNSNRFDLGVTQWKQLVHDVELPPWAKNDPRRFVRIMRDALESEHVSNNLHHWIDLIFGYKQQGKAAVEAQNVFYYLTYEDAIDIDAITDPVDKMSIIAQINNFGQTPHQIFKKSHPPRKHARHVSMTLSTHANILIPCGETKCPCSVRSIEWTVDERLLVACGNTCLAPPRFKFYVQWGHEDQSLWLTTDTEVWNASSDRVLEVHENVHDSSISCATITDDGKFLVTASSDSSINVWEGPKRAGSSRSGLYKPEPLKLVASLRGHSSAVTCLQTSVDYQLVVSGSADGQVLLWDLKGLLLQRRLPRHPGPISCLAFNHNCGDIITCTRGWLFVWNVNGDLCAVRKTGESIQEEITSVCVASGPDVQVHPNIITGHRDGRVQFWKLELPATLDRPGREKGLETEFKGFRYEAPVMDSLCVRDNLDAVYMPQSPSGLSSAAQQYMFAKNEEKGQFKNPLQGDLSNENTILPGRKRKLRQNMRRDAPYMVLQPSEKRTLHQCAVTAIHCPAHTWVRMWTADESGLIRAWKLTSDEHWVQDSSVSACPRCNKAFGVLERRHHCRYCGGVFCNSCSMRKIPVPQFGHIDPVRVCNDCFTVLKAKGK